MNKKELVEKIMRVNAFEDKVRASLEAMDEPTLLKLAGNGPKDQKAEGIVCTAANECSHKDCACGGSGKKEPTTPATNSQNALTLDAYINAAPVEMRATLRRSYDRDKAAKDKLVEALKANPRNHFTAEQLQAMGIDDLENLAELARVEVDYTGNAGKIARVNDGVRVLQMESAFALKN